MQKMCQVVFHWASPEFPVRFSRGLSSPSAPPASPVAPGLAPHRDATPHPPLFSEAPTRPEAGVFWGLDVINMKMGA